MGGGLDGGDRNHDLVGGEQLLAREQPAGKTHLVFDHQSARVEAVLIDDDADQRSRLMTRAVDDIGAEPEVRELRHRTDYPTGAGRSSVEADSSSSFIVRSRWLRFLMNSSSTTGCS